MRILIALAAVLLAPLAASAQSLSEMERDEVRQIIREYLLENPELIEEAVIELQYRRDQERTEANRAAIASLAPRLYDDPRDFKVGPEDAPVQIVEFFDYNCPYCRSSTPWVKELLERHPEQVRFIFKEAPIFADTRESSAIAAQAAIASIEHDLYLDLHFALMDASGTLPVSQVRALAEESGLNWRRAESVMESPETAQQLVDGLDLLDAIGATGTPAFIVNGELVPGADFEQLDELVEAALAATE